MVPISSSSQSSIAAIKNFLADGRLTPLSWPITNEASKSQGVLVLRMRDAARGRTCPRHPGSDVTAHPLHPARQQSEVLATCLIHQGDYFFMFELILHFYSYKSFNPSECFYSLTILWHGTALWHVHLYLHMRLHGHHHHIYVYMNLHLHLVKLNHILNIDFLHLDI